MSVTTSETATLAVDSRYDLVLIAARRVRELRNGHAAQISYERGTNEISVALQEIEQGKVGRDYLLKNPDLETERKRKPR